MIIFLFGKDKAVRKRAYEYLKTLGEVSGYMYENTFSLEEVKRLAESVSLFSEKTIVVLENCLTKVDEDALPLLKSSQTIFFFDEIDEVKIGEKKVLYGEHVFDGVMKKERDPFPFSFCNAIKKRDKKEAWIQFLELKKKDEAEMIHGALLWQVKTIHKEVLEGKKHSYTKEEIESLHVELVRMAHRAREGAFSLIDELERCVMGV